MDKQEKKLTVQKSFWPWIIPFFLLLILIASLPYLITTRSCFGIDFSSTGEIGDTIGGIMGPFIAILAAILTFGAFWVQYQANQSQREQFETQLEAQKRESAKQEEMVRIGRFETRFFELIRLHKENVNEINIKNGAIRGRKAFVYLFQEFRFSYCLLKHFISKEASAEWFPKDARFERNDEATITNLSFLLFFIGVGENSDPLLYSYTKNVCSEFFMDHAIAFYKVKQREYTVHKASISAIANSPIAEKIVDKRKKYFKFKVPNEEIKELTYTARYKPFSGHIANLGHYYRHLFQIVKFVDRLQYFDDGNKANYLKILRAQLSSHEQLLLYYNSISKFGQAWNERKNNFIVKYKMIKNLPFPLAGFGLKPEDKFANDIMTSRSKGEEFFQWFE